MTTAPTEETCVEASACVRAEGVAALFVVDFDMVGGFDVVFAGVFA
jgi:hypothetical protein